MSSPAVTTQLVDTLRAAREFILSDRVACADDHIVVATNALSPDGVLAVAEYDAMLARIDAAITAAGARP